ncbi:MAG TPA: class I SAM-dependent methyltransferase [Acidimicrobiales bacterium]|nr:class I SAM-dependent methyltransferase [Acidimicrobiales bacterium]
MEGPAAAFWAESLAAWAIPKEILDAAPAEPWRFPRALFRWSPGSAAQTPSGRRALEALPQGGLVLDVGVGGGRASLPLAPSAREIVGVDQSRELLATFEEAAKAAGVAHRAVLGRWPDVADQAPAADVVVCHHVFYNVADLAPFAQRLTDHAKRRVVVELTAEHPTANLTPAWRALHGLERPTRPTAADAVAVLEEVGLNVEAEAWQRWGPDEERDRAEVVAFARRRLCVGPERDSEIDELLGPDDESPSRRVVTLWWDGQA